MRKYEQVDPFLKWAGGKRWLAPKLGPYITDQLNSSKGRYIEPFLGAGAMYFSVCPERALLSDINSDLINAYEQIKRNWIAIVHELKSWPVNKEFYYEIRKARSQSKFEKACRFLYLNRTCYGGLYRENKSGDFNVPYGGGERTPHPLWEKNLLQNAAKHLGPKVSLMATDFEFAINQAAHGDVIYCDPTYSTVTRTQFDRYGKTIFSWRDQLRLAIASEKAMDRGALVFISNSGCFEISEFYPRAYRISLEKKKAIGNRANCASSHLETLYILDPESRRNQWQNIGQILNRKSSVRLSEKMLRPQNDCPGPLRDFRAS